MTAQFPLPPRFRVLEVLQTDDVQVRLRVADEVLQRELVLELPGAARLVELDQGNQRGRILREARMLAKVRHAGVQGILDVLEHQGVPILLLEPRQGRTLADLLREQSRLVPAEVQRIGIQVAEATQAVHAAGVVHRDLREANILVAADGTCVLTGFGFAKPQGSPFHGSSLNYGKRGGKEPSARLLPVYPAPEQLRGSAADARSDVYGLGCVLAHCLCGTAPEPEQVVTVATLTQAAPQAPRRLLEVIAGCLAPAPSGRFPTMQAVAVALGEQASPRKAGGRRVLLGIAAVALLAPLFWALTRDSGSRGDGRPPTPWSETGLEFPEESAPAPRAWYAKAHALVIGINYEGSSCGFKKLDNAQRDAEAVSEKLFGLGWPRDNVRTLLGAKATHDAIEAEFDRLRDTGNVHRDDQVLIYFAGHGDLHPTTKTSSYILPHDAAPKDTSGKAPARWLHTGFVNRLLSGEIVADHILIALDCCHVAINQDFERTRGGDSFVRDDPGTWVSGKARLMIAATNNTELASDGKEGGHSPYCRVFLDCLELGQKKYLLASGFFAALRARSPTGQKPRVFPENAFNRKSEFVFGHYPR